MAKGLIVTPDIEALIADTYKKNKKWKAPEVRNYVASIIHGRDPKIPLTFPGISIVQKQLAELRKPKPPDPQDELWCMGTLDKHPIPVETIPAVIRVWKFCIEAKWEDTFTIRKAKWVARLSGVITDTLKLCTTAENYADSEKVYASIPRPFDSTGLDYLYLLGLPPTGSQFYFKTIFERRLTDAGLITVAETVNQQLKADARKIKQQYKKESEK